MNRENPVYDKPFVTKEPGNKLRISKSAYKAWLPMFYCIPKEIVQQRPIYLQLPRCPYEILRTDKYDKIVNDDAFLETIWDAYALCIWQYLPIPDKDEGHKLMMGSIHNYSGDFPLWRVSYMIQALIKEKLESEGIFTLQRLFCLMPGMEIAWASLADFGRLVGNLTMQIIEENHWQPMIDEAWQSRSEEDFDETHMSRDRIDQYRKWSHCRSSMGTPLSLEQISESDEGDENEPADPKGEFEDELLSKIRMEAFLQRLPERDRQIFELKMQGLTDQAIAEKVGFRNHSAVVKRRKQIARQFLEYTDEENLKGTNP